MSQTNSPNLIKDILSQSWGKILYIVALLIWIRITHPPLHIIFLVLNTFSVFAWLFNDKGFKDLLISLASMNGFLLTYIFLAKYLGIFGAVTAFIIIVLLVSAFLLWRQWDTYVESMRTIERMIWGEALDERKRKRKVNRKVKES